jgi:predicted ribosome quality control (RQC) complex YloA/Tae2 family protein
LHSEDTKSARRFYLFFMKKYSFDSLVLRAVCDELQRFVGGRIQGVRQPDEHQIILEIYRAGQGEARWLFDCSAQWARTHLTRSRPANPPSPPAFCMALRKFIDGGQIQSINQRGFDRILDVVIRGFAGRDYLFTAEFMGRHSNLILLDPEENQRHILHAAKLIPAKLSRVREVLPGRVYLPPPALKKADPITTRQLLPLENFFGISPFLQQEIMARAAQNNDAESALFSVFDAARESRWQPVLLRDENGVPAGAYPLVLQGWSGTQEPRETLSQALDEFYQFAVPRAAFENEKRTLTGVLEKAWEQRAQALAQIEHGQGEGSKAGALRRQGELILANLWQIQNGQGSAVVTDYFQDPPVDVTITLDADLSPQENAQRLFDRARAGEKGAARLDELRSKMAAELEAVEAAQTQLSSAESPGDLAALRENLSRRGWLQAAPSSAGKEAARPDFSGKRIRTFTSPDGFAVFVGENAEANDYLVQRVGQSNDWWLHLRAGTSAHAIIRTNNAPQKVPKSTLEFAARLVAQRSAAKHAGVVAVDYTWKKYARKPRGAAPGSVLYTHEKTLHVGAEE